jgi:hypothetical protein
VSTRLHTIAGACSGLSGRGAEQRREDTDLNLDISEIVELMVGYVRC